MVISIRNILRQNILFIGLLIILAGAAYANSLTGQFMVVDDLPAYAQNEQIRNLSASIKTFDLYPVIYSIVYRLFGINPFPLHCISLALHILISVLVFIILYRLFGKNIARIASVLFVVHPVNTEAVSWISGGAHLSRTLFTLLTVMSYLVYRQQRNRWWLWVSAAVFVAVLIISRNPWLFIIPPVLLIIDRYWLESKLPWRSAKVLIIFIIPIIIFYFAYLQKHYNSRVSYRGDNAHMVANQQSLTPLWESAPYTIFTMLKLYAFPKDLTIYYDGNLITKAEYAAMWIIFFVYLGAILFFIKRQRPVAGLLLILSVLLLPTFMPKKITWFMAERYLYFGTAFFAALLAMGIMYLQKLTKIKYLPIGITGVLVILFSARTIIRNKDWQTPEKLALATIKTSPMSVRPYNDLAGAYAMEGRWQEAINYYEKALTVGPSGTAISNLGYIYMQIGMPALRDESDKKSLVIDAQLARHAFGQGVEAAKQGINRDAIYYFNEALLKYPYDSKERAEVLNEVNKILMTN